VRRGRARRGREFPGELERIRVWFRDYKIPSGKPANAFAFEERPQNKAFTLTVRAAAAKALLRCRTCALLARRLHEDMRCTLGMMAGHAPPLPGRSEHALHVVDMRCVTGPCARQVIAETHGFYKALKAGQAGGRLALA